MGPVIYYQQGVGILDLSFPKKKYNPPLLRRGKNLNTPPSLSSHLFKSSGDTKMTLHK